MDVKQRPQQKEFLELIARCSDIIEGIQKENEAVNAEIQALKAKAEKLRKCILDNKRKESRYAEMRAALANPASLVKYYPDMSQSAFVGFAKKELI